MHVRAACTCRRVPFSLQRGKIQVSIDALRHCSNVTALERITLRIQPPLIATAPDPGIGEGLRYKSNGGDRRAFFGVEIRGLVPLSGVEVLI